MLKCDKCGRSFDESELEYKMTSSGENECCPHCGYDQYTEVELCEECNEYCEGVVDGLCPECAGKAMRRFRELLAEHFTEAEIDYISRNDPF